MKKQVTAFLRLQGPIFATIAAPLIDLLTRKNAPNNN